MLAHSRIPGLWRAMVEMFDGVPDRPVRAGVTSMVVAAPNTAVSNTADVALELVSLADATVKVSTRAGSAIVTMVATDDEMRYINASANCID